jgi:polyisoprenoid-binding protein YceI
MLSACLLALLTPAAPHAATPSAIEAPAGTYVLDKTHASLHWRIRHMGLSNYTARFKRFDATLQLDPKRIERSSVEARIDIASLETDYPSHPGGSDFNKELRDEPFFNVAQFPQAEFRSTRVVKTGPRTLRIEGELRMLGLVSPVNLNATLNGSMASHPFAKVPAIGFSAIGKLKRSEHGLNPPPIQQGVGDEVELLIEAEFLRQR